MYTKTLESVIKVFLNQDSGVVFGIFDVKEEIMMSIDFDLKDLEYDLVSIFHKNSYLAEMSGDYHVLCMVLTLANKIESLDALIFRDFEDKIFFGNFSYQFLKDNKSDLLVLLADSEVKRFICLLYDLEKQLIKSGKEFVIELEG